MARVIQEQDSNVPILGTDFIVLFRENQDDPITQSVVDVIRHLFTQARQDKLDGIETGAEVNLTGNDLQTAIDNALGSTVWRSAHTVLRTAVETRDLLATALGANWWQGVGGSGITLDQAIDAVGAALAMLAEFQYDANANTFTFTLVDNSITPAKAQADTQTRRKAWRDRIEAANMSAVTSFNVNTVIPDHADRHTFRQTGANARRLSLPDIANLRPGWEVVCINDSTANMTVAPDGAQTIDGNALLVVPQGEAITLQVVAGNAWTTIADTQKGGNSNIADNSIAPEKAQANTDAEKREWRSRLDTPHISVGNSLPNVADSNVDDIRIITQDVANGLNFRDITDSETVLNAADAGDVIMLFDRLGWVRVGNIITGRGDATARAAAVAAKAIADANAIIVGRLTVFETAILTPGGIPGRNFPEFISLFLSGKVDPRTLIQIKVNLGGQVIATIQGTEIAQFNGLAVVEGESVGPGGIINASLTSQVRDNLENSITSAPQHIRCEVQYKFEGTSLANNVLPNRTDYIHFGTNNNAFESVKTRFETVVGASGGAGNIPVGTHELSVSWTRDGRYADKRILLSNLTQIAREFYYRTSTEANHGVDISLAYNSGTRTLTYSAHRANQSNSAQVVTIKAIGESP